MRFLFYQTRLLTALTIQSRQKKLLIPATNSSLCMTVSVAQLLLNVPRTRKRISRHRYKMMSLS